MNRLLANEEESIYGHSITNKKPAPKSGLSRLYY